MLSEIIAKVASTNVTVNGTTPTAFYGATLRNWTPNAALPCRLLGLFSDINSDVATSSVDMDTNHSFIVTWTFSDLMLWKPTAQGLGMAGVDEDLKDYHDAYYQAIQGINFLTVAGLQARVLRISLKQGQIEYPAGAGTSYYGIKATLTVQELQV